MKWRESNTMRGWIALVLVLSVGSVWASGRVLGQVVERDRDVTITGPRGRSVERQIRSERGPGFIDRQVQIQRPGATFQRDLRIQRQPGFVGGGGFAAGPGMFVPRYVIDRRPVFTGAIGLGLPGLGFFFGAPAVPPPVLIPPPAYIGPPPPVVVYNPPHAYAGPPPPVVAAPVVEALARLRSTHDHSRRDAALTLGRLRDPGAVPALIDHLKHDLSKEVRIASATALAEIGDPRAEVPLQSASMFDKRREVRDAAAEALHRLPREVETAANGPATAVRDDARGRVDSEPAPRAEDIPPPPPTPAIPPFGVEPGERPR
jgi:hypothetical protein